LLWGAETTVFDNLPLPASKHVSRLSHHLANAPAVYRALALFPFIEAADPRAFDRSPDGMARTGTSIPRWLAAIMLGHAPSSRSIDQQFAATARPPEAKYRPRKNDRSSVTGTTTAPAKMRRLDMGGFRFDRQPS
jgi:hypothetical protein